MKILLSNPSSGRNITVEASDEFCANPENITVIIGYEQYKLVSTKSDADRRREQLAQEFADEHFVACKKQNLDVKAAEAKFREALKDPKYADLIKNGDQEVLIMALNTSYNQYLKIEDKILIMEQEIKDTTLDPEVQFDYLARYRKLLDTATTMKEFYDGMMTLKNYVIYDDRMLLNNEAIMSCMLPLLEKLADATKELKASGYTENPNDSKIFNDADYYKNQLRESIVKSYQNLTTLTDQWTKLDQEANSDHYADKFTYYLERMMTADNELLAAHTQISKLVEADNDAIKIEQARAEYTKVMLKYLEQLDRLELAEHFDHHPYRNDEERDFIDVQFSRHHKLIHVITHEPGKASKAGLDFIIMLNTATKLYQAILNKTMSVKDFMGLVETLKTGLAKEAQTD